MIAKMIAVFCEIDDTVYIGSEVFMKVVKFIALLMPVYLFISAFTLSMDAVYFIEECLLSVLGLVFLFGVLFLMGRLNKRLARAKNGRV